MGVTPIMASMCSLTGALYSELNNSFKGRQDLCNIEGEFVGGYKTKTFGLVIRLTSTLSNSGDRSEAHELS